MCTELQGSPWTAAITGHLHFSIAETESCAHAGLGQRSCRSPDGNLRGKRARTWAIKEGQQSALAPHIPAIAECAF